MARLLSTAQQQRLQALLPAPADALSSNLDVYVVGGAVRDALLNLPVLDRDWVVVGTTPEQMAQRGFIPVGGDFPVFLHPHTKEEYALARTERKSGRGYQGFTFYTGTDVTLEDDLARRDLTINALALDRQGQLHDPLNGYTDLQAKRLRHINGAFIEDPVRLLRLARFAARFSDFEIVQRTMGLAQELVGNGEVDALVPERVWQELHKGLNTRHPARMLQVLEQCGALGRVVPSLIFNDAVGTALARGVEGGLSPTQLFALLCHQSPDPTAIAEHLKAPTAYKELAQLLPLFVEHSVQARDAEAIAKLLQRCDVLRRPERFTQLLQTVGCLPSSVSPQAMPGAESPFCSRAWPAPDGHARNWTDYAAAFASVNAGAIAKACAAAGNAKGIPDAVWAQRVALVEAARTSAPRPCLGDATPRA